MSEPTPSFPCRVPKCPDPRELDHLMCKRHWLMLPQGLRDDVWREFRRQAGSKEHLAAVKACLAFIRKEEGDQLELFEAPR